MESARHQIVPCPFRGALDQNRGFNLDEALGIQKIADELYHAVAKDYVVPHPPTAQVEIAILEAKVLIDLYILTYVKGRGLGGVKDFYLLSDNLHLARGQLRVLRSRGALRHFTCNLHHVFMAQLGGYLMPPLGHIRIEHHLHQPLSIPQIDEYQPPVIPPPMHPAGKGHLLPHIVLG